MRATDEKEQAKLTETWAVKLTYKQKTLMGNLSKTEIAELAEFIRIEIAKRIHMKLSMKNFNPTDYMQGEITEIIEG